MNTKEEEVLEAVGQHRWVYLIWCGKRAAQEKSLEIGWNAAFNNDFAGCLRVCGICGKIEEGPYTKEKWESTSYTDSDWRDEVREHAMDFYNFQKE